MIDSKEFDLDEIREGLEMFDVENKGIINPLELKQTMEEMNLKEKNPFMYEMISSLCNKKEIKKNGGITFDEFINYFKEKLSDNKSKKGIKNIFNVFSDVDNKIQMPTFYQVGKEIGDEDNYMEIKNLVEISKTGSRELNFEEFYKIMKKKDSIDDNKKKYFYQNFTYENENLENNININDNFSKIYNTNSDRINQNNRYGNLEESTGSTEFKRYHRKYRGKKGNNEEYNIKSSNINENFGNLYNINSERINQNNRYSNLEESTGSTEFKRYHRKYRGKKANKEEYNTKSDDINERPVYIQFK